MRAEGELRGLTSELTGTQQTPRSGNLMLRVRVQRLFRPDLLVDKSAHGNCHSTAANSTSQATINT